VEEVSMLVATNRKRQLLGVISADAAYDARKAGKKLADVVDPNIRTVPQDMVLTDILPLIYDSAAPIAVLNENKRPVGVIIKGRVIEALTKQGIEVEG
ncbi:CBS domain-containing protein, partial [Streptococcus sobrinus]